MADLAVGARVKYSAYALRSSRNAYLGLGEYTAKRRAQEHYESLLALRGTVVNTSKAGYPGDGRVWVQWDNGQESSLLAYMVEQVEGGGQ